MRVICVDDERLLMQDTVKLCLGLDLVDEAKGFTRPEEALSWMEREPVDVALLDIDMPGMKGIDLAALIREKWPDMPIIFLTGYAEYALDAFSVHASG
ncbi:MAG: response regulator, partial [Blautia sp.]|nr:response regulator [Blautia sp.]